METGHPSTRAVNSAVNSGSGNRALGSGLTAIRRGFKLYECLLVLFRLIVTAVAYLREVRKVSASLPAIYPAVSTDYRWCRDSPIKRRYLASLVTVLVTR